MKIFIKKLFFVFTILISLKNVAQTLNPTPSISIAGAIDYFKGGYTFSYASSGTPWSGSLISFGGFSNQYDTQISSDYGPNGGNHISFRSKNGDVASWNAWSEFYHSGNLNNLNTDFSAKAINTSKINLVIPAGYEIIDAFTVDVQSFGTPINAQRSSFFRVRDIGAGNGIPFIIKGDGNVGIGTATPNYKLDVIGTIRAREIKVDLNGADFVFEKGYKLMPLNELEKFVKDNKHLPEIVPAKEMEKNGTDLGNLNSKLLQKIEELTLYTIEQHRKLELQNIQLQFQNKKILSFEKKLKKIESHLK